MTLLGSSGGGLSQGAAPVVIPPAAVPEYFLLWGAEILLPGLDGFFAPNGTPVTAAITAAAGGSGPLTDHTIPTTGLMHGLVVFTTTGLLTNIRLYINSVPFIDTTLTASGAHIQAFAGGPYAVTAGQRMTLRHLNGPVPGPTTVSVRMT